VGLSAGWQATDIDGVVTNFTGGGAAPANQNWNVDQDSPIFGGIIGIQHQFGSFVLGLEANLSTTHLIHQQWGHSRSPTEDCVSAVGGRTCNAALAGNLFTVGPRLGWAYGKALLFATGGYAQAELKSQLLQSANNALLIHSEDRHNGWFLGAGIEWAAWKNLIVGLEYQRVHLGDENHRFFNANSALAGGERATFESDTDIFRARVTYKFDRECCARPLK
jgi:outer membrane immunogenic protein